VVAAGYVDLEWSPPPAQPSESGKGTARGEIREEHCITFSESGETWEALLRRQGEGEAESVVTGVVVHYDARFAAFLEARRI